MKNEREALSLRADRLGIFISAACFVHCILTPVVLSLSTVTAHFLPSEEKVHRVLAMSVAAVGGFAIISGYRRHRRARVLLLMTAGLFLIFGAAFWGGSLGSHAAEIAFTMLGSGFMISSHLVNHTFCKDCRCAEECDGK
jgi:MerC mercury resistance protein